jgi:hypothetical protein
MGIVAFGATAARAQSGSFERKVFGSIDVGAQPQQQTIETSTSFPLYDETATVVTHQPVHNGVSFGLSGGYRTRPDLGFAVGLTFFNARRSDSSITASIPDLTFFNRPRVVTASATGFKHQELGVHFQAVWFRPLTDAIDLSLAAGPSIVNVKHDLATATVATGTQNLVTSIGTEKKTALGFNVGGDGSYALTDRLRALLFVRYIWAKADLPSIPDLRVGGLQTGLGLRMSF